MHRTEAKRKRNVVIAAMAQSGLFDDSELYELCWDRWKIGKSRVNEIIGRSPSRHSEPTTHTITTWSQPHDSHS